MKKAALFSVICFLSACILLAAGCSSHNKNVPEELPADDTVNNLSENPGNDASEDTSAKPAMTPVIVSEAPTEISVGPGEDISEDSSEDSPDDVPEAASETSSDDNPDPDEEQPAPEDGFENTAGIFTSSEITEELKLRINGKSYADGCTIPYEDLRYLQLSYVDFNGNTQLGEMICNKAIAADLLDIFSELYHNGYQIDKIRLIDDYNADDDASCDDDNTSCFNYRVVAGSTNLSKHAQGVAVDINPFYNPYVTYPNGKIRISPVGSEAYADRSSDFPHKIDENDLAYKLFTKHGFAWGGHWKTLKDYQHFQKPLK